MQAASVAAEESESIGSEDSLEESEDGEEDGGADLVFPASFAPALAQLLGEGPAVAVQDVRLDSSEDRLGLVRSLWMEGLVCTVAAKNGSKKKKLRSS